MGLDATLFTEVERVPQRAAVLRRQFLQGDAGIFDQVLGDQGWLR